MPNSSASKHEIDEQRSDGTGHAHALQARHQRANRLGKGNGEKDQENSAERARQHENHHQRDQRDTCREPERALREGDGEAAWRRLRWLQEWQRQMAWAWACSHQQEDRCA